MIWSTLVLLLCYFTQSENVDMFFSGGGIRATYGTLVAMCEVLKYWEKNEKPHGGPFTVENVIGLSGGAWGVSLLGGTDNENACQLVEKVKALGKWGEVREFSPTGCSSWSGLAHKTCFRGWTEDIDRWFTELLGDHRREIGNINKIPNGFGKTVFGEKHTRVWIQTDPCHFGSAPARFAHHDGSCIISANELTIYCAGDLGQKVFAPELDTHVESCKVGDEGLMTAKYTPLTFTKLLSFSSAAWASATVNSNAATIGLTLTSLIGAGDKTTPEIRCKEGTETVIQSSFCDAGGECNLPMGALDVMYRESLAIVNFQPQIVQFVAFDYSDNSGDNKKAVNQCLKKWELTKGWKMESYMIQPWGYTVWMKDLHQAAHEFIVHVVLFRGIQYGDRLVKVFPTISGTSPNFFTQRTAKLVADEYKGFLESQLFGVAINPFNTPARDFKERLKHLPQTNEIFVEEGESAYSLRKEKVGLEHILQPR